MERSAGVDSDRGCRIPTSLLVSPGDAIQRTGCRSVDRTHQCRRSGAFFGPLLIGLVKRGTGGDSGAFLVLAGVGIVGCLICIGLRQTARFSRRLATSTREVSVKIP